VRAREAVRADLMRCRHRLSKLLLRHGIRFDDGQAEVVPFAVELHGGDPVISERLRA